MNFETIYLTSLIAAFTIVSQLLYQIQGGKRVLLYFLIRLRTYRHF
jgi:hypothetical protein